MLETILLSKFSKTVTIIVRTVVRPYHVWNSMFTEYLLHQLNNSLAGAFPWRNFPGKCKLRIVICDKQIFGPVKVEQVRTDCMPRTWRNFCWHQWFFGLFALQLLTDTA